MARRVFFSFEYEHDVSRAMVARTRWVTRGREAAGFVDAAEFEHVKRGGDAAIKSWIGEQPHGTSVPVVLVGSHTCASGYIQHEIDPSGARGNGLLGIDGSKIRDLSGKTTHGCGRIPEGYDCYRWNRDDGSYNRGGSSEEAARNAGC